MPQRRRPRLFWRILRVLVVAALVPTALTLLYLLPFVHPVSTLMLKDLALLQGYDRRWAPIEEIGDALVHSVIMSEDGQFCSHHGIDFAALNEVLDDALDGGPSRGASTITMQTVKNLYLWHRPLSSVRKVIEAPLAAGFDLVTPKKRIMEIYLNIAEWGPGVYGAEAAAQRYFKRSAKSLTRRQAALLAAALPNPYTRNPAKPGKGMQRVAAIIERRAAKAGDYVRCVS